MYTARLKNTVRWLKHIKSSIIIYFIIKPWSQLDLKVSQIFVKKVPNAWWDHEPWFSFQMLFGTNNSSTSSTVKMRTTFSIQRLRHTNRWKRRTQNFVDKEVSFNKMEIEIGVFSGCCSLRIFGRICQYHTKDKLGHCRNTWQYTQSV